MVKQVLQLYIVAIVSISSKCGLTIEACCGNQANKTKLAMHKAVLHFKGCLKQLCISNKREYFSYIGKCGICVSRNLK